MNEGHSGGLGHNPPALSGDKSHPPRIDGFPQPPCRPWATHEQGGFGAHQGAAVTAIGWLWPPQDDRRTEKKSASMSGTAGSGVSFGQTVSRTIFRTSSLRENGIVVKGTKKSEVE